MSSFSLKSLRSTGFSLAWTGGGCTALEGFSPDGKIRILITDSSGTSIPEETDEGLIVGLSDAETDELLDEKSDLTVSQAVVLARAIACK